MLPAAQPKSFASRTVKPSGSATARCAPRASGSPLRSPPRTTSSSRCPTSVRRSGTWRTPPGSSSTSSPRRRARVRALPPAVRLSLQLLLRADGRVFSRLTRGLLSRPTVADVYEYRAHVDRGSRPDRLRRRDGRGGAPIELGLHHEQQHQELLLTDIKHILAFNPLGPVYRPRPERRRRRRARWAGSSSTAASG